MSLAKQSSDSKWQEPVLPISRPTTYRQSVTYLLQISSLSMDGIGNLTVEKKHLLLSGGKIEETNDRATARTYHRREGVSPRTLVSKRSIVIAFEAVDIFLFDRTK